MTVVLQTRSTRTYVGRFDSIGADGVLMLDVGIHEDGASPEALSEYVRKSQTFGIKKSADRVVVPEADVKEITRLGAWTG